MSAPSSTAGGVRSAGASPSKERRRDRRFALTLMTPATAIVTLAIFWPLVKSVWMGLTDYSLARGAAGRGRWNGFANYRAIAASGELQHALGVTLRFMSVTVTLLFALGLTLALILNHRRRGRKGLRTLALLPWVTPTLIAALLWSWMFQGQYGVVNYILLSLGVIDAPLSWLVNVDLALPSVIVAALWRQLPFMFVLLLAGLQSIPTEMYEVAHIEGAGAVPTFRYVTLPFLSNVIRTAILLSIIANFKQFPLFWTMTAGGPIDVTTTLAILSYRKAFVGLDFGAGAAVATMWLVVLLAFAAVYTRLFRAREVD